jgi:acyl-CoA hydrolase
MTQKKEIQSFTTYRLIKSEDLNHHGTLYAGRSAEWFVESGFVAASAIINPKNIICLKIHGMHFSKSAKMGQTIFYTSKIVYCGRTSIVANICVKMIGDSTEKLVEGFITFVHVNENTCPIPHNIEMIAVTDEDKQLQLQAINLKKQ